MNYFKIITDDKQVIVFTSDNLRRYQTKHNVILASDEDNSQFAQIGDNYYRDSWMKGGIIKGVDIIDVKIVRIEKEEYDAISSYDEYVEESIGGSDTNDSLFEDTVDAVEIDENDVTTVEFVKGKKIQELKRECDKAITDGVDIAFNGVVEHYSLTVQDQLNISALMSDFASFGDKLPYHPDGGEFRLYSGEDISTIAMCATRHITNQLAYFNKLKSYVNKLNNVIDVSNVVYGMELPEECTPTVVV